MRIVFGGMVCTLPIMPCVPFSAMWWGLEIRQVVDKIEEQVRKCALTQDAKFLQNFMLLEQKKSY